MQRASESGGVNPRCSSILRQREWTTSVPLSANFILFCSLTSCLGNLWRRLVLPKRIGNWSLTSLQQRLVKTGGRLIKHARYYWLLLAESHLTRRLFASMLGRIDGLSLPSG